MTQWGFVINISRCVGCYACFIACKDEYWDNDYLPYTAAQPKHGQLWMNLLNKERGAYPFVKVAYMPIPCMQCADAPCIKAARNNAVYRRDDGIVVIDPGKAAGQKQLLKAEACPYRVIFWNDEKQLPQKCTFCAHRLEQGKNPRCVDACPSECLLFGDLDDPGSQVSRLLNSSNATVYHPEWETKPLVYYIDLYKITKLFLAGEVVRGDTKECAGGVTATLADGEKSWKTTTDFFGHFEFDGLGAGGYRVKLDYAGYTSKEIQVDLTTDCYLGDISIERAD